ncbi:MAG: sugar phosphate isomerase/epimerase [Planktomarina sp.]|nr:sugar phosphate isomerase/epimerase [Planktomarina sp.]
MTKFSYQLYSSRKFGPIESTLEMVSQCGYRQVEAYGGLYADLDRLERALGVNSLVMPTGHFDLSMIEQTPNQAIEIAKRMGMTSVIVPFLNLDDRPADANGWQKFSDQLSEVAKPILDAGLTFAWHNHDFEFNVLDSGEMPLEFILRDENGVSLELDLAWVVVGGESPFEWVKKYADRLVSVHLKDIAPKGECVSEDGWADVGHGTMNWSIIMDAVQKTQCKYFVMEHDNPNDDIRFAERSIAAANKF